MEGELRCAEEHAESLRALAIARGQQAEALRRALRLQKTAGSPGCDDDDDDDFAIEAAWGRADEAPGGADATAQQQQQQQRACLLSATAKLAACEASKGILAGENARLRELLAELEGEAESQGDLAEKVEQLSARVGQLAASGLALQQGLEEQAAALQVRPFPSLLEGRCTAALRWGCVQSLCQCRPWHHAQRDAYWPCMQGQLRGMAREVAATKTAHAGEQNEWLSHVMTAADVVAAPNP